jgi:NAD+ diphosphatase
MFKYCPTCQHELVINGNHFSCKECGFEFYAGPNPAVGVILINPKGQIYLGKRARAPRLGFWDMPGGFVDFHESAEDAARREIKEELNIEIDELELLCTFPNIYPVNKNDTYPLDIFLIAKVAADKIEPFEQEEFSEGRFFYRNELPLEDMAFKSQQKALGLFLKST